MTNDFEIPEYEYECEKLQPTHIINYYNLEGKLLYTSVECTYQNGIGYFFEKQPNDDVSNEE